MNIIPIALTFDENYVLPAAVAMFSLLQHSNRNFLYEFNIIHHGLSQASQEKLRDNLNRFSNCAIKFIYCDYSFCEYFRKLKHKNHFSPEMFYKLLTPSLLPNYDKIIISDVDVIFKGDISTIYQYFNSDNYVAAIKHYSKTIKDHLEYTYKDLDIKYWKKISNFGAGFLIFNLKKMRKDKIEQKMLQFLEQNIERLYYPEQEIINYVCFPKVEYIDIKYMVVPSWIKQDILSKNINKKYYSPYTPTEVINAVRNPIQLHYASSIKPWNNLDCDKYDDWFNVLILTTFKKDYLRSLQQNALNKIIQHLSVSLNDKIRYYRYKLLSKITFGELRKHYKRKKKDLKQRLKQVRKFLKGK